VSFQFGKFRKYAPSGGVSLVFITVNTGPLAATAHRVTGAAVAAAAATQATTAHSVRYLI